MLSLFPMPPTMNNTWLGSIGVAALHDGDETTTFQFTAADQLMIGEKVLLDAKTIKKLTLNEGQLSVLKVPSNHTQQYPQVQVDFIDSKLSFTVGYTKNSHLGSRLAQHRIHNMSTLLQNYVNLLHIMVLILWLLPFSCRSVLPRWSEH